MKGIEIIEKRKPREKHFLQENGDILAVVYSDDVHYLKNGKYEEIDNQLIEDKDGYYNAKNSYKVHFNKNINNSIMKLEKDNHYLDIRLMRDNPVRNTMVLTHSKDIFEEVRYNNVINNIDFNYKVLPTKVKEEIIINNKEDLPSKIEFIINSDLSFCLNEDRSISAFKDKKEYFKIEAPYMTDSRGTVNNNIYYNLSNIGNEYKLDLIMDDLWLKSEDILFPITIDPTITNYSIDNNVYDTYIYPGDTNIDRNSQDILKAGVERVNGNDIVNRTLLRFELPVIGTGSQVIDAQLQLVGYGSTDTTYMNEIMEVRRITHSWTESAANWNNMNDKFDATRIDGCFYARRSSIYNGVISFPAYCYVNLTDLVKKWYTDLPNYGIMIKSRDEVYKTDKIPAFFSKNNAVNNYNPKPLLQITYRNQNGLENYMKYIKQNFVDGKAYVNVYNGNFISSFNVGETIGGKLPVTLDIIYNTNNVVLNDNFGYGLGWKFNLHQTIRNIVIDNVTYLEYVDGDGTIHYFRNYKNVYDENGNIVEVTSPNTFYDEDGLSLTIRQYSNYYILSDKDSNEIKFDIDSNIGYLTEISDVSNNRILIEYNSNHFITKITDSSNSCINIIYENNAIRILCPDRTTILSYNNNKLVNVNTINGDTIFEYNNNLISKITDISGKKVVYQYYDNTPYKIKKITEYGINNSIGKNIQFNYKFSSTTLVDNMGRTITYVFNRYGNVTSITNLKDNNSLKDAYGKDYYYGIDYQDKNKISSKGLFTKYVNNHLTNTSFEEDNMIFTGDSNVNLSFSNEYSLSGSRSLKLINSQTNSIVQKSISVTKGEYYTFSLFARNNNKLRISLSYIDHNNMINEITSDEISPNQDFERYDVSAFYPSDALSDLIIKIYLVTIGTAYIDDIQLEDGEIVNRYNYVDNSNFSNGSTGWVFDGDSSRYEIVTLNDNGKALKINMDPSYTTLVTKTINISGSADDTYSLSFWYKNEGLPSDATDVGEEIYNNVSIAFNYNDSYGSGIVLSNPLIVNNEEWQFFTCKFKASRSYSQMTIKFLQIMNANKLYITNVCLYKDERKRQYLYDANGNISKILGVDNNINEFKYDINNKLINLTDPKGENYKFEYDTETGKLLIGGLFDNGVLFQNKYDSYGNNVVTKTKYVGSTVDNGLFRIRSKGTNYYLTFNELSFSNIECGNTIWNLESDGNYYKIKHPILTDSYINVISHEAKLGTYQWDNSLYDFIEQEDGSYLIKCKVTNVYLINNNGLLDADGVPSGQFGDRYKFYVERVSENAFIEDDRNYTETGKFISNETDSILNKTNYQVDPTTGLIASITNAKGQIKTYDYNQKRQLIKITQGDKIVNITYDNTLIKKISSGNKDYNFAYNDFCKLQSVKIGNNTLSSYFYNQENGNISKLKFGNDDEILYTYDDFNRIKTKTKMDDEYNYGFNNNGLLARKVSTKQNIRYYYEDASRLKKIASDDFGLSYSYDSNGNNINKIYRYKSINNEISNLFSINNSIIKTIIGDNDNCLDYIYDGLGRLSSKKINNTFITNYNYLSNGNRESLLIRSIDNNGDNYSYKYDKLSNITHVYHNGVLKYKYRYDDFNQLIEENDYLLKNTIRYKYDASGNIVSKKIYELETYNLLDKYIYQYNDSAWIDKLTKFNDKLIQYDEIGNPISIGSDVTLTWKNGVELSSYCDNINTIYYDYDDNGRRISKNINGNIVKYVLEGNKIVYEERGENIIHYIYNDVDNLIGFIYQNQIYFYVKNLQNDIIKIVNSNFVDVAKYEYDGYGNIIRITDGNGNIVNNNNSHIANVNPFRYRSYYYDSETNLYYLNNRYYSPLWCRFISPDSLLAITDNYLSNNLYVFALNNPINYYDEDGKFWKKIKQVFNKIIETGKKIINNIRSEGKKVINKIFGSESTATTKVSEVNQSFMGISISNTTSEVKKIKQSDALITSTVDTSVPNGVGSGLTIGNDISIGFTTAPLEQSVNIDIFNYHVNFGYSTLTSSVFVDIGGSIEKDNDSETVNGTRVDVSIFTIAAILVAATFPETIPALGLELSYAY